MRRLALRSLAVLLAVAVLGMGAIGALVFRNLPDRSTPRIPGLRAPVTVSFDDRGVPLVVAASIEDAFRVQGYLTARERLFQLELQRRAAAGELAEVFGRAVLDVDRLHRTYGFARVAAAAVALLPKGEHAGLEALCDGMNAFLSSHGGRLGLEFTLLGVTPRRFTPSDSLLVHLLMYEDLTATWRADRNREKLGGLPAGVRRFLDSAVTRYDAPLVKDATPLEPPELPVIPAALGTAASAPPVASFAPSGLLPALPEDEEEAPGSNNWAVAGSLTVSGKPMLANDPHLGLNMPGFWLPMRFEIAGHRVEGVTLPGLPGVILGRTDRLAWAFTNLEADVADLYRETIVDGEVVRGDRLEPLLSRTERIAVRGGAPVELTVRETSHGPLVEGPYALKWVALDPRNVHVPSAAIELSATEQELDRVFDLYPGPAQNVVWASSDGSIGWRPAGLLPIRRPGTDGSVPYDGRDPENDWRGYIPPEHLPRIVNPEAGYIITANQRTIGTGFGYAVRHAGDSPTRARRIAELLEEARRAGRRLDRAAMERIQLDTVSEPLRRMMGQLASYLPEADAALFRDWNGRADDGSVAFLIARALRAKLRSRVLKAWGAEKWPAAFADDKVVEIALAEDAAWRRAGLGEKRATLADVVKETLAELESRYGKDRARWTWGDANRLGVHHPLGRVPGLSWLFDPPRVRQAGAPSVVRVARPTFGQSMRFLVDFGDPSAATLVVPFGVSGHLGSSHRLDQLRTWHEGDPTGTSTRLARAAVGEPLVFRP